MKDSANTREIRLQKWWLGALILAPLVLWILPSTFFDGEGIILCPSRFLFGIECLGCGMTRAVMHFHHFEFEDAIFFNYGVVAVYPALVVLWISWVWKAAKSIGWISKAHQTA